MARGTVASPALGEPRQPLAEVPPAALPSGDERVPPRLDEGDSPSWPPHRKEPFISNARLGMLMFLAFETMFFGGLLGAFLVFRLSSLHWPPPGQPYLPGVVTWINSGILLGSSFTMRRALRAIRAGDHAGVVNGLGITALLGTIFLVVQGTEWVRLVHFGLTLSSGTYGSIFYTLIGCHGVHVLGAVFWLLVVLLQAVGCRFTAREHVAVQLCGMYWYFVVGLWPVLFTLVYLS
ncbi:MAG: heme-copper oxidase subunit III [candidate division NC10 bacterium]|nr:heme-copper oxidase subunit III [candidate division NC10 bacterium]